MKRYGMIDVAGLREFKKNVADTLNAMEALLGAIRYPPLYPKQADCVTFGPHPFTRTLPTPDHGSYDGWDDIGDPMFSSVDNAYKFTWIDWRVEQIDTVIGILEGMRENVFNVPDDSFFVPFDTGRKDFPRDEWRPGSYDAEQRKASGGGVFISNALIDNAETALLGLWYGSPDYEPALDHHIAFTGHYDISGDPVSLERNDLNMEDDLWFGDWFNRELLLKWLAFYRAIRLILDAIQIVSPDTLFASWQVFHPGTQTGGRGA